MNKLLKAKFVRIFGTKIDFAMVFGGPESTVGLVIRGHRNLTAKEQLRWAAMIQRGYFKIVLVEWNIKTH